MGSGWLKFINHTYFGTEVEPFICTYVRTYVRTYVCGVMFFKGLLGFISGVLPMAYMVP